MTEAKWLRAADLQGLAAMERYLEGLRTHRRKAGRRKMRLFGCACCRSVWELLSDRERSWVAEAERIADGEAQAPADANSRHSEIGFGTLEESLAQARFAALCTLSTSATLASWTVAAHVSLAAGHHRYADHCRLLREVFGNPFVEVKMAKAWLRANDRAVERLAREIYGGREFGRLPILADALEDAGCADEHILAHCRSEGPHVRGCWAVDLSLGLG